MYFSNKIINLKCKGLYFDLNLSRVLFFKFKATTKKNPLHKIVTWVIHGNGKTMLDLPVVENPMVKFMKLFSVSYNYGFMLLFISLFF